MKVEARVLDVTTTLEGEKIGMTIAEDALAHIMSILTDLYSDPELAVIREYSTNAFDEHVEAFVDRPIEVTLPTALSPFFRVRDYGRGLNADDIREMYSQYGASTKRDSDDVVGMLGLGCKSALTYSDQFTLSSVKDGILTQVSISRDEDGSGSMTIVSETPTTELSGTEIIVPTKSYNEFESKAADFFRFWAAGTVLVNGEKPKRVDGMWIADDLLLTDEVDEPMVVMGNVAYPWPNENRVYGQWPTVAFVEIGAVQFTPSRESLQMTSRTKTTLTTVKERVKVEKDKAFQALIDEAPTAAEALAISLRAQKIGFNGKPTYNGVEIPEFIEVGQDQPRFVVVEAVKRWRQKGWSRDRRISNAIWPSTIWLTGYTGEDFSPHKRKKIDQWKTEKGLTDFRNYVLIQEDQVPVPEWIHESMIFPWAEVAAQKIKIERTGGGPVKPQGSYEAYVAGKYVRDLMATDIDTSNPVFYVGKPNGTSGHAVVTELYPNCTLVVLGLNRINKFKRDFPAAKNLHDHVRELAKKFFEGLTEDEKIYLHIKGNAQVTQKLRSFEAERVDDPELKAVISIAKENRKALEEKRELLGGWYTRSNMEWVNPLDKYTLLTNIYSYGTIARGLLDHLYLYFNAAHAAGQEATDAV